MCWSFRWLTDWDEIWSPEFVAQWRDIYEAASPVLPRAPFFHPDVVRCWTESVGAGRLRPYFLMAQSSRGHRVLLPLAVPVTSWRQGRVRRLRPVGDRFFDYHDPLVSGPEIVQGQERKALDDSFWLNLEEEFARVEGDWFDDAQLPRVRAPCAGAGWPLADKAPCIDLSPYADFDVFLQSRAKSLRGDIGRQKRKLEASGALDYVEYDEANASDALSWAPRFEAARCRRYPGSALPPGYVERLISSARLGGPVHCSALTLDGRAISWHVGFYSGDTLYWYLPMFDEDYQNYSPGKVHIFLAIRSAFARGARMIDFLRGQEAYKSGWTDGEQIRMMGLQRESETMGSAMRLLFARALNKAGYVTSLRRRWRVPSP